MRWWCVRIGGVSERHGWDRRRPRAHDLLQGALLLDQQDNPFLTFISDPAKYGYTQAVATRLLVQQYVQESGYHLDA